ncbi:ewing's tumor-associated antigen 1 [Odontesthes bonariensis]|uniref:ewing's tumor-associated antigen 1 n=1 Tax=Odontesthes bonariensis TaxID=219752 RepID=UPI003F581776
MNGGRGIFDPSPLEPQTVKAPRANRLSRSLRQTQAAPAEVASPRSQRAEFKSPTRVPGSKAAGVFSAESPHTDSDFQQDIVWDATSPSPRRPGKKGKKHAAGVVNISEIVSRIAPKHGRPQASEPTLQQWIGDSATIPCTPDVQPPRAKKKSPRPNSVDDLLRLARRFDFNMFHQDDDEEDVQNHLSPPGDPQPDPRPHLDLQLEDDLDFLFDGPTQHLSRALSQPTQVKAALPSAPAEAHGKPPASRQGPGSAPEFQDDWEDDDLLNDSLVLEITQNPQNFMSPKLCSTQKPAGQSPRGAAAPVGAAVRVGSRTGKENLRPRATFQLQPGSDFSERRTSAETGPTQTGPTWTGPMQTGPQRTGPTWTGPQRTGPTRTGPTQPGPTQTGPQRTGPTQTGPTQTGPQRTGPTRTGPQRTGPTQTGPTQTGPQRTGPTQTGPQRTGPCWPGPTWTGPTQPGPTRTGPQRTGPTQTAPTQTGPQRTGPTWTGPTRIGPTRTGPTLQSNSGEPEPQRSSAAAQNFPNEPDAVSSVVDFLDDDLDSLFSSDPIWDDPADDDLLCEMCEDLENQVQTASPVSTKQTRGTSNQRPPLQPIHRTSDNRTHTPPAASGPVSGPVGPASGPGGPASQVKQPFRFTQTKTVSGSESSGQSAAPKPFTFKKPNNPVYTATSEGVGKCSAAEIQLKKQQAMARRRRRLRAAQNVRAPT